MTGLRCDGCTAPAGLPCAATRHPRFCHLLGVDPAAWGPIVVAHSRQLAGEEATPAAPDPVTLFVDLCEFRQTCQCNAQLICTLGTLPGVVNRDQCRACAAAELTRSPR